MRNYITAILRIYLSNGFLTYNDESINENVSIHFKQRRKSQLIFICIFVMVFAGFSHFKIDFEITAKLMTALYLAGDIFNLARKVQFQEIIPGRNYYSTFSLKERLQNSQVGGLNILMFFMLFMK